MSKKQIIVTKKIIREMIKNMLESTPGGDVFEPELNAANVSAGVDPNAAATEPGDENFKPQNKTELGVAITNVTKDLPDDQANNIFQVVKAAMGQDDNERPADDHTITSKKSTSAGDDEMKNKKNESIKKKAERALRLEIRKALREAYPNYEYYGTDMYGDSSSDDDEFDEPQPVKKKRAYKDTAIGRQDDVGGDTFESLAKEFGLSIAGAKRLVDETLKKSKHVYYDMEMSDDLMIVTLGAIKDYVDFLKSSGELTPADVQFLLDHPSHIQDLEGFREFFSPYLRKYLKKTPQPPEGWSPYN